MRKTLAKDIANIALVEQGGMHVDSGRTAYRGGPHNTTILAYDANEGLAYTSKDSEHTIPEHCQYEFGTIAVLDYSRKSKEWNVCEK